MTIETLGVVAVLLISPKLQQPSVNEGANRSIEPFTFCLSQKKMKQQALRASKAKLKRRFISQVQVDLLVQTLGSGFSGPKQVLVIFNKMFIKWPQRFSKRCFRLLNLWLSYLGLLIFWLYHLSPQHHVFPSFKPGFSYQQNN